MMTTLERWFGGPPAVVLVKLLFLSLVVGTVMAGLGLSPGLLMHQAVAAFRSVFGLGFDAIHNLGRYAVTGAVIVVPIWLLSRMLGSRR